MLSRIPIPVKFYDGIKDCRKSAIFFPWVGLLLGVLIAIAAYGLANILPVWTTAVFVTLLMAGVSGAFHLDGVGDCADGFLSSRPPEKMREIMKDSRVGAMGVLALIFIIVLKISLIAELAPIINKEVLAVLILLAVLHGRCALCFHMKFINHLDDKGLGHSFWNDGIFCFLQAILISLLSLIFFEWQFCLILTAVQLFASFLWALYCRSKIKGGCGDTLGAACEIGEAVSLLTSLILVSHL